MFSCITILRILYVYSPEAICKACVEDGVTHPDVVRLSKLGSDGANPQNCLRQMNTLLKRPTLSSAIGEVEVPMKIDEHTSEHFMQSIIDPHAAFADIYTNSPEAFESRICGGNFNRISSFWHDMQDHPGYATHPDHITKCIPIDLHGDGVPVVGVGKSWGGVLSYIVGLHV